MTARAVGQSVARAALVVAVALVSLANMLLGLVAFFCMLGEGAMISAVRSPSSRSSPACSTCGSANSWSVPMIENTAVRMMAGITRGILMRQAIWMLLAPSSRAAS